jgi:hypothetical protein
MHLSNRGVSVGAMWRQGIILAMALLTLVPIIVLAALYFLRKPKGRRRAHFFAWLIQAFNLYNFPIVKLLTDEYRETTNTSIDPLPN